MNITNISPEAKRLYESLIKQYPLGFSISPSGDIYEVAKVDPPINLQPEIKAILYVKETK